LGKQEHACIKQQGFRMTLRKNSSTILSENLGIVNCVLSKRRKLFLIVINMLHTRT